MAWGRGYPPPACLVAEETGNNLKLLVIPSHWEQFKATRDVIPSHWEQFKVTRDVIPSHWEQFKATRDPLSLLTSAT